MTATLNEKGPHVVVLGNEKGGSGKSTTAMHIVVAMLRQGFTVGAIDLDARQGTLTRYLANRVQATLGGKGDAPLAQITGTRMRGGDIGRFEGIR